MRNKVTEPERVDEFIHSFNSYNSDSKAIVLRLVNQLGNVSQVASLTGLSERTIYDWLGEWPAPRWNKSGGPPQKSQDS